MTAEQADNTKSSLPPRNELLRFSVPEVEEVEIVLLKDKKGNIIARTAKELEKR